MKQRKEQNRIHPWIAALLTVVIAQTAAFAQSTEWERKEVNWRVSGGRQIKAIYYPKDQNLPLLETGVERKPVQMQTIHKTQGKTTLSATAESGGTEILANVINSPPIDGFTPYVAIAITDEWSGDSMDSGAYQENSIVGSYLPGRTSNYVTGIFDTGASAHIINAEDAITTGIVDAGLVTSKTVEIIGAAGTIDALVSQPLAIFADGLGAINPNTLNADDSNMKGQSNVATILGDMELSPDLPTVVGSPLAFFFTTVIENSKPITLNIGGDVITAPNIHLHEYTDSSIPAYPNKINLELRPSDGYAVQYMPCFELLGDTCPEGDGEPSTPSVVFGTSFDVPQSLFFATRTDITASRTSTQNKFMFDTGAQITVISEDKASEIELLARDPNFYVEIFDATGASTIADGYYIELLEINASPAWLSFTHVPVIVLDVTSPEGGVLNGILGMNLFANIDFYIRGGGLYGQAQPYIKFAFLPPRTTGDIFPAAGDGLVNLLDLGAFAEAWLADPLMPNWNSQADMVSDGIINFFDFAVLSHNWR